MTEHPRYLLRRGRHYFARIKIPKRVRAAFDGKTELCVPLGVDGDSACSELDAAVMRLKERIDRAKSKSRRGEDPIEDCRDDRLEIGWEGFTSADTGIIDDCRQSYRERLRALLISSEGAFFSEIRLEDDRGAGRSFDPCSLRKFLRQGLSCEMEALRFLLDDRPVGACSPQESSLDSTPRPGLTELFSRYLVELKANGTGRGAEKRWRPVVDDLIVFAGTDDPSKMTRKTIIDWKDAKLLTLSPRTVKYVHLAAINAIFNWALSNALALDNPAAGVRLKVAPRAVLRPRGFSRQEGAAILQFSRSYQEGTSRNPRNRESPQLAAAKKWVPLLCAFTGARISEITQLRKADILRENSISFIRITPDAGTVKTRQFRDVPLHGQIVSEGFCDFVAAAANGPLFYPAGKIAPRANPAQIVSGRLSRWLHAADVIPKGVPPNHGWRHAFKTTGRELGIDGRVLDAIAGHAPRTVGDDYGEITLVTKKRAIDRFPQFDI